MKAPDSGVTVRMYNPGFGDCFLLAFPGEDGSARYMLIDCGVHHQYPRAEERMRLVAEDIAKATGNRLHVVAVTHEHTDHVYGFKYGKEAFDGTEIDEVWLAWTEDPDDEAAKELKQLYGMMVRALRSTVEMLRRENKALAEGLQGLLEFEMTEDPLSVTGATSDQLDYLRRKSKKKLRRSEDYRHPGEPPTSMSGVEGVRFYVLGPPSKEWIRKLTAESEMYLGSAALNVTSAFTTAALQASGELRDEELFRRSCPFDETLGIRREDASRDAFFQRHYGFEATEQGPEWRRIDTDWLAAAEQLALSINGLTNNTSLVLAVELTTAQPRKVLLFTGDAQVGSWLSWNELHWNDKEGGIGAVGVADLLNHTVLYKVGHHGSRNATLSTQGLERMNSADLVAMIPVDEEWATGTKHWEHPAARLYQRLQTKTRGRIIRADRIPSGNKAPPRPEESNKNEWRAFKKQLEWDRSPNRLWIQYSVQ
jgi:beta-lactamase superfamily II metal-dependent hydrolase